MIKVYYDPASCGFYQSDIHKKIPITAIEIPDKDRWDYFKAFAEGSKISVEEGLISIIPAKGVGEASLERLWRDEELQRADIELFKCQDSDSNSKGTVGDWRQYRRQLRDWPAAPNFPDKTFRPVSPDKE